MKYLPALVLFILSLFIFEGLVGSGIVPSYLFPAPSSVLISLKQEPSIYLTAFRETAQATLLGFLISAVLGSSLALLFSLHSQTRNALLPFFVLFQVVPIVAIAPLLVIWFGFGAPTVCASAAIVSIFPVLANTLSGLELSRRDWLELFKILGAKSWQTFFYLRVPSALPDFFNGLRISAGLSVIGAIVGEFIAGGGLGGLIDSARTQQRLDQVFGAIFFSALLGIIIVSLVDTASFGLNKLYPINKTRTES